MCAFTLCCMLQKALLHLALLKTSIQCLVLTIYLDGSITQNKGGQVSLGEVCLASTPVQNLNFNGKARVLDFPSLQSWLDNHRVYGYDTRKKSSFILPWEQGFYLKSGAGHQFERLSLMEATYQGRRNLSKTGFSKPPRVLKAVKLSNIVSAIFLEW